jgi:hypothetical protein
MVIKIPNNLEMKSPLPAPRSRTSFSRRDPRFVYILKTNMSHIIHSKGFWIHHTFSKHHKSDVVHSALASWKNPRSTQNILSRPQHWQQGAGKSTPKLLPQFIREVCCSPLKQVLMSKNNLVLHKRGAMLHIFFFPLCNLLRSYIPVYTLEVNLAFVFQAVPQHSNISVQTSVLDCLRQNMVPCWRILIFVPSEICVDEFAHHGC